VSTLVLLERAGILGRKKKETGIEGKELGHVF
jgi:hypothetical protein